MANKKEKRKKAPVCIVHAYPDFVYAWPLIVLGYFFAYQPGWVSDAVAGWVYAVALVTVALTLGFNLNRNVSIFIAVVIGLCWVGILWLKDARHVMVFGTIGAWIAARSVTFSRDAYLSLAILLSIPYLIMWIMARVNDRWRFTHNEIEHRSFGISDNAISRGAKQVRCKYSDVLQIILGFGAGDLEIRSANAQNLLAVVRNVPGLFWRYNKISKIIESTAVSPQEQEAADAESQIEDEASV